MCWSILCLRKSSKREVRGTDRCRPSAQTAMQRKGGYRSTRKSSAVGDSAHFPRWCATQRFSGSTGTRIRVLRCEIRGALIGRKPQHPTSGNPQGIPRPRRPAPRSRGIGRAALNLERLSELGIDLDEVTQKLEGQGMKSSISRTTPDANLEKKRVQLSIIFAHHERVSSSAGTGDCGKEAQESPW